MDRSLGIEHDDVRESSESCFKLNPNGWSSFFGKVRGNSERVESVIKRAAEDTFNCLISTNERKIVGNLFWVELGLEKIYGVERTTL